MSWITVHGSPGFGDQDIFALLDTGADVLMLPESVAHTLSIDIANCPKEPIEVASGAHLKLPQTKVEVTLRGRRLTVDAIFGIRSTPLIGLRTIVEAMDFGVDDRGWLYRVARGL